jgi:hypothetical protein
MRLAHDNHLLRRRERRSPKRTAFTTLNMAVVPPMPSAR